MEKGFLKKDAMESIEDELTDMTLLQSYLSNNDQRDEKFNSIRNIDELVLLDGGLKIPKVVLLENADGRSEILKKHSLIIDKDRVAEVEKNTKLDRKDIMLLMQDGMSIDDIEKSANELPFKEIAESSAIREMIRKNVKVEQLQVLESKGIQVVPLEDGSLKVNSLEKLAQVDQKGELMFDEKWLSKQLNIELLIDPKEKLVVQDHTKEAGEKNGTGSLEIVPLEKRREDLTKEEIEKQEIAKELGENPDDIISVIRIEDRDAGSKIFNQDMKGTAKPIIVRFRNNNFKLMEEKDDGTRKEMQGFEATPISKQLAATLKDTRDNVFTSLKAGEVRAGKTNPNVDRYNLFQIRRAGESLDDDQNMIMYVGYSGETDINAIKYQNYGSTRFERVPVSSVYPRNIYIESSNGTPKKTEVAYDKEEEKQQDFKEDKKLNFNDIQKRQNLLARLAGIESKIHDLKQDDKSYTRTNENEEEQENENSNPRDKEKELSGLYEEREEVLKELGMSESKVVEPEEEEYVIGTKRNRF